MMSNRRAVGLFLSVLFSVSLFGSIHAARADVSSNLILHYTLDDNAASTAVIDTGSNGINGAAAANTSALHIPGLIDTGAFALASSSRQYIDTDYTWSASDSNYTVSAWVKAAGANSDSTIVFGSYNGQNSYIQMGLTFQGYAFCAARDSAGASASTPQNTRVNDGKWHLLTCTNNGTAMTMYIDGAPVASASASGLNGNYRGGMPRTLLVGQGGNNSGYVNGSIDDVRVYNRALSGSDVDELAGTTASLFGWWKFDEGSGTTAADSSPNGNTGTLANSPTWVAGKVGSGALSFVNGTSGTGSYVSTANTTLAAHENLTWAAWVYPTNISGQSVNTILSGNQWGSLSVNSDGYFHFTDRAPGDHAYTGAKIPLNAWTHLAVTCNDSAETVTMYINGAQVKQDVGGIPCYNNFSNKEYIGTYGPAPAHYGWTGYIDDVRIYDGRALSAADIAALYSGGSPTNPVAPQISSVASTTTATTAVITWTTDQSASSTVSYGVDSSYGNASTSDAMVNAHSIALIGLAPSTMYHFQIASGNGTGQIGTSTDLTFTTLTPDTIPPVISSVASTTSFTAATVTWSTDEVSDSEVLFGTSTGSYTDSATSSALVASHSLSLDGLTSSTGYYFVVVSTDSSGNTATSSEYTFITGTPDTTAPVISSVTASTAATTATIAWDTDEAASSTVLYGLTSSYGTASTSLALTTSHSIKLAGLMASTTYHFAVQSTDASGNATTSPDFTFTTDTTPGITLCGGGSACITLHDGDVIGIVGDSITSINLYIAYLASYFDLRYPNIHLHFRDLSRSGAAIPNYTAPGNQYIGQVDPLRPNVVILMMTNNGGFTSSQYMSQVQDIVNNYIIATSSAQPFIFDVPPENTADGDSLLSTYSQALQPYAESNDIPIAAGTWNYLHTIWSANMASTSPVDIQDGGDADHMGPPAHLGIAYAYLSELNADPNVSSATIDAATGQVVSQTDATISNVTKTAQGIDFTRLDTRLPMAYDDRSLPIFQIMPQIYDMNRYMLTVDNLDPGDYYVYIDGIPSGEASSDQLAAGWNMSTMTSGPIHDQLQDVLGKIRAQAGLDRVTRGILSPNTGLVEYISNANGCYYSEGLTGDALKNCVAQAVSDMNALDDQIYAAAQPIAHTFSLRKAVGTPDVTAPVLSNPIPSASLPQGTSTTTLSITTDEDATCKYGPVAQTPYIWMPNTFDATGGTVHSSTISGLLDGVTYTYYIRCEDAQGNRDMHDYTLTFSVDADPNPIAYYKFDEGTGSTTADSSGNGHTATLINSPTWVPGKVGPSALSFNGTDDVVNAGDVSDADGVGALTVAAWVKGSGNFTSANGYEVVTKYASGQGPWTFSYSGASRVYACSMVNSAGASVTAVGPIVPLDDADWHYVACVYNGTNLTVYTDGATSTNPNDSPALTGVIKDTTYPVCIGGFSDGANSCLANAALWQGTIDDLRIYKRALSASELASLAAGDLAPPAISLVSATSTDTAATVAWTTDENASSLVDFGLDTTYGSASSSNELVASHSVDLTGLTASSTYHFQVVSTDSSGNVSTSSDFTFTTAQAPDTTAPAISSINASTTDSSAHIIWNTDESADSLIEYGTASGIYSQNASSSDLSTAHAVDLIGLNASTTYYYIVASSDSTGNTATSSEQTFSTSAAPDTTAPSVSSIDSTTTETTATITWNTDEAASSSVSYGFDTDYRDASSSDEFVTSHAITLEGLTASTTYHFQVSSSDASGNVGTSSDMTFTTIAAPDVAPPVISSITATTSDAAATITWSTDELSDSSVLYGTSSEAYTASTSLASLNLFHSIGLSGLTASTTYYYAVSSVDASGNTATSSEQTFSTSAAPDTTAPVISAVTSTSTGTSATIAWTTDEAASSTVEYGADSSYGFASSSDEFGTTHSITLINLNPNTLYHFRVSSADAAGNVATSSDFTVSTLAIAPQVISSIATSTTSTTATVTWVTGGNGSTVANHSMIIEGLVPSTTYHYHMIYTDDVGNAATSSDMVFTTAP